MRLNYSRTGCTGLVYDEHDLIGRLPSRVSMYPCCRPSRQVTQERSPIPISPPQVGTEIKGSKLRLDAETPRDLGHLP